MMQLRSLYHPLAAAPLVQRGRYRETPPCAPLAPYVYCFWELLEGGDYSVPVPHLVNPDTCMDIIFQIKDGRENGFFCGINDHPFLSDRTSGCGEVRWYAVRFYGWAVSPFSVESMALVQNASCDPEQYFGRLACRLSPSSMDFPPFEQWIGEVQKILLRMLRQERQESRVMNAVYRLLIRQGRVTVPELAGYACTGARQLERLFREYVGVSPKKLSDLVRYQSLWRELATAPSFSVLDAVERYGYTDQSHLLRDFRKYHGASLTATKQKVVGFLQDTARSSRYDKG